MMNKNRSYDVGERGGERGKQVGSMNEESQVINCYSITFNYTNQETVSVLDKTQANKQPASAGTLGEKGRCCPSAQAVLTL